MPIHSALVPRTIRYKITVKHNLHVRVTEGATRAYIYFRHDITMTVHLIINYHKFRRSSNINRRDTGAIV